MAEGNVQIQVLDDGAAQRDGKATGVQFAPGRIADYPWRASVKSEPLNAFEKDLGGQLLASVSRTFYLTLKALPRPLREPISLAYLLARTADTIADTAQVPSATRLECLERFRALVLNEASEPEPRSLAIVLQGRFCPHQTDEAEARLMSRLADAIAWLRTVKGRQLATITDVLKPIIQGQMQDIRRFPDDGKLRALATAAELDDYTWLVAGCVGEFWTKLCLDEMPDGFASGTDRQELVDNGIRYGKGLQLINILRDLPEDIAAGRCYLPENDLKGTGKALVDVRLSPRCLDPLREAWQKRCEEHLERGLLYLKAIREPKLKYATALPLMIGARTSALLRGAKWEALAAGVKVSRFEIAKILAETALACRKAGDVEKLLRKLAA
jgi:farnesyl-diphosphate farnesyltransferase